MPNPLIIRFFPPYPFLRYGIAPTNVGQLNGWFVSTNFLPPFFFFSTNRGISIFLLSPFTTQSNRNLFASPPLKFPEIHPSPSFKVRTGKLYLYFFMAFLAPAFIHILPPFLFTSLSAVFLLVILCPPGVFRTRPRRTVPGPPMVFFLFPPFLPARHNPKLFACILMLTFHCFR